MSAASSSTPDTSTRWLVACDFGGLSFVLRSDLLALFDECQQVFVDRVSFSGGHAVGKALVGDQCSVLQQLCREWSGIGIRHNLVVIAVHYQNRHSDLLQIFSEVSLGEGDNAVIMRFGAAHHALSPPIPDHRLRDFRT